MEDNLTLIRCNKCGLGKTDGDFYHKKSRGLGLRQPCKECIREHGKLKRLQYRTQDKVCEFITKVCGTCNLEKPVTEFRKRSDTPTGVGSDCKDCISNKRKQHYQDNKERTLERTEAYRKAHPEQYAGYTANYRSKNRDKCRARARELRAMNRDAYNARDRERRKDPKVKEKQRLANLKYTSNPENAEKKKASSKRWRAKNKHLICHYASLRRSRILQATPSWADLEVIKDFYKEAEYHKLQVDHIIPLTHPLVCGLHVEWNLQLLPRSLNAKKHNKFEICDHEVPPILEFTYEE